MALPIYPPDPILLTMENHLALEADGDGDGIPDPGETITLSVEVMNSGTAMASGVQAFLSTSQPGITIVDSVATFPDIPVNQSKTSDAPHFAFKIGAGVGVGTRIDFNVRMTCNDRDFPGTLYDYVGKYDTCFVDRMEMGSNGWTHGGTNDDWQLGKPVVGSATDPLTTHSGDCIRGNNLSGNYANNAANYLESPIINCRDIKKTRLTLYRWLAVEKGIYDQARILVNGHLVWENDANNDLLDSKWTLQDYDISAYADTNAAVRVRFELSSDAGLHLGGWSIDDVAIVGIPSYLRGDSNHDGLVNVSDVVLLIDYIFAGGTAPSPVASGDADCSGLVNVADAVYLIAYIFTGGAAPCAVK